MEIGIIILLSVLVGFLAKKKEFKIGISVEHKHRHDYTHNHQHNYKHEYQEIPQTPTPKMTDEEMEEQGAGAIDKVIQAVNEIMGVNYEQEEEQKRTS